MKIKLGVWALALLLFGSIAGDARATDHSWNNYHWARMANPMPLRVIESVTSDWQTELGDSLSKWGQSSVIDIEVYSFDDGKGTRKKCKAVDGQMRVCNAAYGYNGWLGMATIYISGGHITKGTAKVNDSYSSYWDDPDEKNHVMCQEIGHVFGLGHTSTDGSSQGTCMDYSSDTSSQWPNSDDYSMLAAIYAHTTDGFNSYDDADTVEPEPDSKSCNPRSPKCNANRGPEIPPMGVRVHQDRYHEIWVARGHGDDLWIHHVTLVPEEYR